MCMIEFTLELGGPYGMMGINLGWLPVRPTVLLLWLQGVYTDREELCDVHEGGIESVITYTSWVEL